MDKVIEFGNVAQIEEFTTAFSQLEDSYLFCKFTDRNKIRVSVSTEVIKLNGSMMILHRKGAPIEVEINRERCVLEPNSITMIHPGSVFRAAQYSENDAETYTYVLFFILSILQNINLNLSMIALPQVVDHKPHALKLDQLESDIIYKYFELLHLTNKAKHDVQMGRCIASSIIAAMFYQTVQSYQKHIANLIEYPAETKNLGRRHDYVREFIQMVQQNFMRERSVAYYAERLFISPKYLSLLVKEATGRSAAKWIDGFVLMEAKNMLRYSGKNIQQVAYALNFPTQSSFGKYFKHLTGMSPTEYQHS